MSTRDHHALRAGGSLIQRPATVLLALTGLAVVAAVAANVVWLWFVAAAGAAYSLAASP